MRLVIYQTCPVYIYYKLICGVYFA
uniref:Uncharacterized protein n=1 Tax=Arundo donax TaxID=35708 RepID=A0A0A9HBL8_ARUDO